MRFHINSDISVSYQNKNIINYSFILRIKWKNYHK